MMVELNAASRKKSQLVEHVTQVLRVPVNGNETVKQLMNRGIQAVYDQAPASGEDPVGFGQHAGKTYAQLLQEDPQYCRWVTTMAKEEETCSPRLLCGSSNRRTSQPQSRGLRELPSHPWPRRRFLRQ